MKIDNFMIYFTCFGCKYMRKIFISCFVIIAIIVTIVIYKLDFSSEENLIFELSADDITLSVGEKEKIQYETSIEDAVFACEIEDCSVAKLFIKENSYWVEGLLTGETFLTITGKYKGEKVEEIVNITITNTESPVEEPLQEEFDDVEDFKEIEEEKTPNTDTKTDKELKLSFSNLMNCTIDEKTIKMTANKMAIFSINCEENIETSEIISNDEKVVVTKLKDVGYNTYKLKTTETGTFEILIKINNQQQLWTVFAE